MSDPSRLDLLREMVAADPDDLMARLLLGQDLVTAGRAEEAVAELTIYVDRFHGDKGAACGSLARALESLGRVGEAVAALRRGIENAHAHRHLQLAAQLEADLDRLSG